MVAAPHRHRMGDPSAENILAVKCPRHVHDEHWREAALCAFELQKTPPAAAKLFDAMPRYPGMHRTERDSAAGSDTGPARDGAGRRGRAVARREVLLTAAMATGAVAIADLALGACSSSPSGTPPPRPAGGIRLVALARVPLGEGVVVNDPTGYPVVVAQPTTGIAVAFSAICPHQGCTVAPDSTRMQCPCHGSLFDVVTGRVLNGPATTGLKPIAVRLDTGDVVTA